jgi:hypothetical protein
MTVEVAFATPVKKRRLRDEELLTLSAFSFASLPQNQPLNTSPLKKYSC